MSLVTQAPGQERTGTEYPSAGEVTPALRARAARAQMVVGVIMVVLIVLPVVVWWVMFQ
jgi:hypothetical protein